LMVLEALAALGLAANIGQFIGYSLTLVSKAKEIHQSHEGATKENVDREVITKHLQETLERFGASAQHVSPLLVQLRARCETVITELLAALKKLESKGKPSKWKNARRALKVATNKDKVEGWVARLRDLREEYQLHIVVDILSVF